MQTPAPTPTLAAVKKRLRDLESPEDAAFLQRFFRTGPGEYGEGDRFLGIRVPTTRRLARECSRLSLEDVVTLLHDEYHEARLLALVLLGERYKRGGPEARREIFELYLANVAYVNNWDLVDLSAPEIVGAHLADRRRALLDRLARSKNLWERRIAIVATHYFIRVRNELDDTLRIARILLRDEHDLIHKATGWMLREVGKRDQKTLERFLEQHAHEMPRTMLRYAIERMTPAQRARFMAAGKASSSARR